MDGKAGGNGRKTFGHDRSRKAVKRKRSDGDALQTMKKSASKAKSKRTPDVKPSSKDAKDAKEGVEVGVVRRPAPPPRWRRG